MAESIGHSFSIFLRDSDAEIKFLKIDIKIKWDIIDNRFLEIKFL